MHLKYVYEMKSLVTETFLLSDSFQEQGFLSYYKKSLSEVNTECFLVNQILIVNKIGRSFIDIGTGKSVQLSVTIFQYLSF